MLKRALKIAPFGARLLASALAAALAAVLAAAPAPPVLAAEDDLQASLAYFAGELRAVHDAYGLEERRTIRVLERLAQLYESRGFRLEAVAIYGICRDLAAGVIGSQSREAAMEAERLAAIHLGLGNILTAEALLSELSQALAAILGEGHQDTLSARADLAVALDRLGRTREGLAVAREVLAGRESSLGPLHERTAAARLLLARLLASVPEYDEALAIIDELIAQSRESLGPFFPDRLAKNAMSLKTDILWARGSAEAALEIQAGLAALLAAAAEEGPATAAEALEAELLLASMLSESGQAAEAEELLRGAEKRAEEALGPESGLVRRIRLSLAGILSEAGQAGEAAEILSALGPGASAEEELARILADPGDPEGARSALIEALLGQLMVLEDNNEAIIDLLTRLAQACQKLGSLEEAAVYGKLAIEGTQAHKFSQRRSPSEFRRSYMSRVANRYHLLAQILFESGRVEEALKVLSLLKLDELGGLAEGPVGLTGLFIGPEAPLAEAFRSLVQDLRDSGRKAMLAFLEAGRIEALASPLPRPEAELSALRAWFESLPAALGGKAAELALASGELRHGAGFFDLAASMGERAAIIHTLIVADGVYLVSTRAGSRVMVKSEVDSGFLTELIRSFRRALEDPASRPEALAGRLYSILLAPISDELAQADVLVFSLDGLLRLIPMAALHDGERWLVESHPTALISGAGLLEGAGLADGGAEPMMAALGVSRPVGGFAALPAVTAEIEALIRDETNPEGFYPGVKILDESFTYERLRQVLADRPAYVHLASHFLFDPGDHRASRLLLGDGGQLSLARLDYDGSLSFKGIRHISLSACQTAVGEISDDGREVESLGSLIHRKGAGSVLASLWRVDDASTMRLMESFYGLQKSGLANRAEALRAAQLAFVEGGGAASGGGPTRGAVSVAETPAEASGPDPSHPYYWAPFIIMGDFR